MPETLTIEFSRPRTVDDLESIRREASTKAYEEAVLDLVRQSSISLAYGAELLGINEVDMLEQLRQHAIAVADYSEQELVAEVKDALRDFSGEKDSNG